MTEEKEPRITLKNLGIKIGMADYRFLIALILVLGLVMLLFKGDFEAAKILVPLVLLTVEWYFKDKAKKT
jgi:hypothetical protein